MLLVYRPFIANKMLQNIKLFCVLFANKMFLNIKLVVACAAGTLDDFWNNISFFYGVMWRFFNAMDSFLGAFHVSFLGGMVLFFLVHFMNPTRLLHKDVQVIMDFG